jgi:hypothetical protein
LEIWNTCPSTSSFFFLEVYGLNTAAPFSEEHRTDRATSLYVATKKAGEAIAHAYNHLYDLSIMGLRFFTVYVPWGRPDMTYFAFACSIVADDPITLFHGTCRGCDPTRSCSRRRGARRPATRDGQEGVECSLR